MAKAARGKKVKVPRKPRQPRTPKSKIESVELNNELRRSLFFNLYDRSRYIDDVLKDVTIAYDYLTGNGEKTVSEPGAASPESLPEPTPYASQPDPAPDEVPSIPKSRFETDRILM
jgi:hypothetical protein